MPEHCFNVIYEKNNMMQKYGFLLKQIKKLSQLFFIVMEFKKISINLLV